jgi:hypothetical protein
MRARLWLALLGCFVLMFTPTRAALAANHWCDTDPVVMIQTPAGRLVPVYVNIGADSATYTPDILLSLSQISYSVAPTKTGGATLVKVHVTVPTYLTAWSFQTRVTDSSGAFGSGTVYAQVYGLSDQPMTSVFTLPYP